MSTRYNTRRTDRLALLAVGVTACALVAGGCEDSSGSSSSSSSNEPLENLSDNPQSLLGRSAKSAKDLRDQIEQRDAAATGLADELAGVDAVEVAGLRWSIPEGWTPVEPGSPMRQAELHVEHALGASVVTFSTAGGTVQQNLSRWGAQVLDSATGERQRPRADVRQIAGLTVHVVEFDGTYMSGMPGGRQTEIPYQTLLGAIVESPDGLVFVKMTGPEDAMRTARGAWDTMIGGMTAP